MKECKYQLWFVRYLGGLVEKYIVEVIDDKYKFTNFTITANSLEEATAEFKKENENVVEIQVYELIAKCSWED